MMQLSVVRHGITDFNLNGYVQGRTNIPLNPLGKEQAKHLGHILMNQNLHFDVFASSSLSRALETLYLMLKKMKIERSIKILPKFAERDFAHLDGKPVDDVMPLVRQPNYESFDYETDQQLITRIHRATMNLYQEHKNQNVLLVAHSHVIKALLILSNPKQYTFSDFIGHTEMFVFEIDHQKISLIQRLTP